MSQLASHSEPVTAGPPQPSAEAVDGVFERFGTSPDGLTAAEAKRRQPTPSAPQRWRPLRTVGALAESLGEPLQLLLIAVGVLSAVFGEVRDAIAIFVIIALVAAVETISEERARRSLEGLKQLSKPTVRVRRDGDIIEVSRDTVVTGDVVLVEAGDVVPADCRVVRADGLAADESALTGEPVSAPKGPAPVASDAPLAERSSMLYAGTAVTAGSGEAVVVATGEQSELGRIGALVESAEEPPTPLQRTMAELARAALIAAVAASVLVPLLGVVRGQPAKQMLLDGLTLAFATIPEELPILVTVLVAVGGLRLARRGVLLRRLRAAEAAGAVTVVLTDKTGTLTENRLELARVWGERDRVLRCAQAAHGGDDIRDPLDQAVAAANGAPIPAGEVVGRHRFDPQRKRESAVWRDNHSYAIYVKGAPENVLAACAFDKHAHGVAVNQAEKMASDGLRVVAVAERHPDAAPNGVDDSERELEFVGLIGFADPVRDGVREAVTALRRAGVRTAIVTGDHPFTAATVAREIGLPAGELLRGGGSLAGMSDAQLAPHLRGSFVVARATPEDKLRLVRLLQQGGDVVAVTGDGINDAPALAAADVGIAMGKRGTDLARDSADLILTDDAYPTVVAAIEGGRGIGEQLRRAVAFYLGAKLALVAAIAIPLAAGLPSPFEPIHIVLLELFMDIGASVAFVAEPPAPAAMTRPPRDPARRFLDRPQLTAIGLTAVTLAAAVLPAYLIVRPSAGTEAASAAAVAAWLCAHAAIAWALRTRPRLSLAANPAFPTWALVAAGTALLLVLTPAGRAVGVEPLAADAIAVTAIAVAAGASLAAFGRRAFALTERL